MKKFAKILMPILLLFSSLNIFAVINSSGGIKKVERQKTEAPEEPKKEEPKKVEAKKEEPKPPKEENEEYKRSVGTVKVSEDTFKHDKQDILKIIDELSVIMEERKYKEWLKYVDQTSIDYWTQPKNLTKAQKRLPVKGLRLRSLEDYFKFVFIPSRRGKNVTEIRYESDTYVKAVEVTEENGELIYYYFNKIKGEWKIHLPPIAD